MTDLVSWYPGLDATKTFGILKPKTALPLAEKGIIYQQYWVRLSGITFELKS